MRKVLSAVAAGGERPAGAGGPAGFAPAACACDASDAGPRPETSASLARHRSRRVLLSRRRVLPRRPSGPAPWTLIGLLCPSYDLHRAACQPFTRKVSAQSVQAARIEHSRSAAPGGGAAGIA